MAKRSNHQGAVMYGHEATEKGRSLGPVLLLASSPARRRDVGDLLVDLGYEEILAPIPDGSRSVPEPDQCAFTVLDLTGGADDGEALMPRLPVRSGPIIAVGRNGAVEEPESLPAGAVVVREPLTRSSLEGAIKDALLRSRPSRSAATEDQPPRLDEEMALWCSPRMQEIRNIITLIAGVDVTVLINGETGTGKDVVARSIHHLSARRNRPFVKVNCAALPRDLLESELFGHERGAFTGAHELKIGQFERANHGALFLDEIGDLHPDLQGKLLHVLQDGEFSRVGGRSTIKVDVRVLAATNQDLERNVAAGTFREDLLYRLNVIQIAVPPLRERLEEVPALAQYFVRHYCQIFRREPFALSPDAIHRLMQHRYAGNVRELENIVKRMIVLDDPGLERNGLSAVAPVETIATPAPPAPRSVVSLKDIGRRAAQEAERVAILQMLEQTRWNRLRAAKLLNISYRALLYKIKESGIGLKRTDANGHE